MDENYTLSIDKLEKDLTKKEKEIVATYMKEGLFCYEVYCNGNLLGMGGFKDGEVRLFFKDKRIEYRRIKT